MIFLLRKINSKHTVSGLSAPDDSTLKKNLFGTLFGSNGASYSCSCNSKFKKKTNMFTFLVIKYQYALNGAILPVLDKQYDEEHYLDRIQMKHPEGKTNDFLIC